MKAALKMVYHSSQNPSQVIRTVPRGQAVDGAVPPVTLDNLPSISENPADEDRIRFIDGTTVYIPE